jgi:glycosyltransferase involved in cell wall biosynthesis
MDGTRDGKTILTVARLSRADRYKGIQHVIKVLPSIRSVVPGVRYTIVGAGGTEKFLYRLASNLGVRELVRIIGRVTDSGLAEIYQRSDIFVMPSLKEGFGIVYLEAMSHGMPVVAGNHGGAREAVVDGKTGYLVDFGDLQGLSRAITRLLQDRDLRLRMGDSGRTWVQKSFSFDHFSERVSEEVMRTVREERARRIKT